MKILLINIDSTKPNLALKKIEKYYKDRGDEVIWDFPLMASKADKIYVSVIYTWNKNKCWEWEGRAEIGGTGYDVKKALPLQIEKIKPKINIGFTTRGCIRKCKFCVVQEKEGNIKIEGDIYDIWDGRSKEVEILDNNILALPDHFKKIWGQIKKENLKIRENGLDIRLLDRAIAKILKSVRHHDYHFAFDNMTDEHSVIKGIKVLRSVGIKESTFYVLVGFNTTSKEDLHRLNLLRSLKQNAFVQRYNFIKKPIYVQMARWANQHGIFRKMTWLEFLNHPENKAHRYLLKKEGGECLTGSGFRSSRG